MKKKENAPFILNSLGNPIRVIVTILGLILGISGIIHGYYEILQGNKSTNGMLIQAIGKDYQNWLYGGEEAITIIPNFLLTGLITIVVSLILLIWTIFFIQTKYGSTIFLLLNILSFLTGGGIFQIVIFSVTWIFSTRINGSLKWWEKNLSQKFRERIKNYWLILGIIGIVPYLIAQEIGIYGFFPGITDPEIIMNIVMVLLFASLTIFIIAFISSFAYEIERNKDTIKEI